LSGIFRRDTDRDWETLGASQPYWGVYTHPAHEGRQTLDAETSANFFASGESFIAWLEGNLQQKLGAPAHTGSALDFGCGVGRLLIPFAKRAERVVGVDAAASMRERCVQHMNEAGLANAEVVGSLDDAQGPFDWVNTYIVLQHIEPARGYRYIKQLSALTARGGALTLHVTTARDDQLKRPSLWKTPRTALAHFLHWRLADPGFIMMYDYDLARVIALLTRDGFGPMYLEPLDHGGHRSVIIHTRKVG
jgi:2-polyprenyl-3-methyl-5-hydroxy-6-metoxy-1,4-benzoquinol methylase